MPGKKRPKHVAVRLRKVLAANVVRRMEERYKNNGDMKKALAESAGVTLSTIQRVTQPERYDNGATIDTIDQVAKALRCEPSDLLKDDHIAL